MPVWLETLLVGLAVAAAAGFAGLAWRQPKQFLRLSPWLFVPVFFLGWTGLVFWAGATAAASRPADADTALFTSKCCVAAFMALAVFTALAQWRRLQEEQARKPE